MALLTQVLFVIAYVVSGKLGLMLALPPGYASPIFPPAGIAMAAAFVAGRRAWPWVFLGSLLLNIWVGYSDNQQIEAMGLVAATVIATASMLQAAVGGWGLRRLLGYPALLNKFRNALSFLGLAPVVCVISASLSVGGLWGLGILHTDGLVANWVSWWLGDTLGVLALFPLVMIVAGEPRAKFPGRVLTIAVPILLVLVTGLVAIYFLQNAAYNFARRIQQDNFEYQGREVTLRIEQRLAAYEQVLRGVRGLYAASHSVERKEFHDYVATLDLEEDYPGILGVGFSKIVQPKDKAGHIEAIRKEGFPGYRLYPEGERELYTSIVYLEPFTGRNLRAFGYDMYSEAVRRSAMERARDLDEPAMSAKVRLVQENGEAVQSGFLMYLPVYRNGAPHETVAERRANIIGWVYAPFRMNDLMQGILGEQIHNLDLEIFDDGTMNPETLMYDSRHPQAHIDPPLFHSSRQVRIIGHVWTVKLHSLPGFEANIDTGRVTLIRVSGLLVSLLLSLMVWQLASGRARAIKLARDMTHELIEREKQLKEAQRMAHVGSWKLDIASGALNWSDEICHIFEVDPSATGHTYEAFLNLVHPEDRDLVNSAYTESVNTRTPYSIEHRLLFPDGRIKYVQEKGETFYDAAGKAIESIGTVQDITEQKLTQERIQRMAHYDTLTNLPNRALFYDRLRQALALAKRNEAGLTLLYLDLDGFKLVNDTLGHQAGDLLLKEVAARLAGCVRESDTVSRLGGDEFTIILGGAHRHEDIVGIAEKVIQAISVPFDLKGKEARIGISIGIARFTEEASSEDQLVKQADQAMYKAKAEGKNTYRFGSDV